MKPRMCTKTKPADRRHRRQAQSRQADRVYIRVTENDDNATVTVDVKYDKGTYRTIDAAYAGAITDYPAGNEAGCENYLAVIGNNSGSGAIEFNMYKLTFSDTDPEGTPVVEWSLY